MFESERIAERTTDSGSFKYGVKSKVKFLPIVGQVACGEPAITYYESGNKFLEVGDVSHLATPFILLTKGDSMSPYINPHDKLVCTIPSSKIKDGSAVVVSFKSMPDTYEANAKLIRFLKDEKILLYSINTKFPPMIYSQNEIYQIYKVVKIIRDVR